MVATRRIRAAALAATAACSTSRGGARPLVVLPLGDSITEGVPTEDGYRGFLRDELARRGIAARYGGTRRSAAGAHEGWSGITADQLLARVAPATAVAPDLVLLHVGTNDIGMGQDGPGVAREVEALVAQLAARAPRARVLLARIVPMVHAGARFEAEVGRLNDALPGIAARRRAAGQAVDVVDQHGAIDPRRHLEDPLHPNAAGYRAMARVWADAIARVAR